MSYVGQIVNIYRDTIYEYSRYQTLEHSVRVQGKSRSENNQYYVLLCNDQ
jgi:hypothetical protein